MSFSPAGAADPIVDRGHRPAAGAGRGHAGRRTLAGVATITLPLALPRRVGRDGASAFAKAIGEFGATITLRVEHSRRNPDHFLGDLFADSDPRMETNARRALRLVLISIVIAMSALIASEWFARRRHPNACTGIDHAAR